MPEPVRILQKLPEKNERIHFVGIGGIGMSGIAEVLLTLGYSVSGSDLKSSKVTKRLARLGAVVRQGHMAEHVRGSRAVVISAAIAPENPEVAEAHRLHISVLPRAEMLAELMKLKYGIAISGTHGKTTVSSMIAVLLASADLDPTAVIGGRVDAFGSSARLGKGRYMVVEADESDRSFLYLEPSLAVLTNMDREHLDQYRDMEEIESAFAAFAGRVEAAGAVVCCADDRKLEQIVRETGRRVVTYGIDAEADLCAVNLELNAMGSAFEVQIEGKRKGRVNLRVPGRHNVLNSLAAIAVGCELSIPWEQILKGLESFRGVDRRLQVRGEFDGVTVLDDYCHHPTEIRATLSAARLRNPARLWGIFQPHRYTRTAHLMDEFAGCFAGCDRLSVLDIYPASESPIPGITAESLVERIRKEGIESAHHAPDSGSLIEQIVQEAQPGDLILTMGAGSVTNLAGELARALEAALAARQVTQP